MQRIYILTLILFLVNCGTETGNPFLDGGNSTGDSDSEAGVAVTRSEAILEIVCNKLVNCYSSVLTTQNCLVGIKSDDAFDTEFGLEDGIYSDFKSIITAEENGTITSNKTEATQCLSDIKDLACSDTEVGAAFDTNLPSDFSSSHKIIPFGSGGCNDLF